MGHCSAWRNGGEGEIISEVTISPSFSVNKKRSTMPNVGVTLDTRPTLEH